MIRWSPIYSTTYESPHVKTGGSFLNKDKSGLLCDAAPRGGERFSTDGGAAGDGATIGVERVFLGNGFDSSPSSTSSSLTLFLCVDEVGGDALFCSFGDKSDDESLFGES